jgi:hypothetical protein
MITTPKQNTSKPPLPTADFLRTPPNHPLLKKQAPANSTKNRQFHTESRSAILAEQHSGDDRGICYQGEAAHQNPA